MNSLLAEVIVWLVGSWVLLVIVLDGVALLQWLTGMFIVGFRWSVQAAWQCFVRFLIWFLGQLRKRSLQIFGSLLSWWPVVFQVSRQTMKRFWRYLKKDQDHSEAEDFQQPTGSAYEQALEILGLADQPDFTSADLKKQLRKMRAIVHPDKGFPNRVFIQQLNDAFAIVKRERNWS